MTEREAYIALNRIEEIGPVSIRSCVTAIGSAASIFSVPPSVLRSVPGLGRERAEVLIRLRDTPDPAGEERAARAMDAHVVTLADADYPEPLASIHDPPSALYVRGDLVPEDRRAVAIVGSRGCSGYGRAVADRLGYELARAGFTVVSGLARGIDQAAHEGALKANGRTLAVLGSALDRLYPPEAAPLADRIARHGAVLSEYALGRPPDRTTFPYRNRIVSGLSMGVIVVEGDVRSGAMITADRALEQGRSVFAVPGRIDSPTARGPHRLLKNGARLIEDVGDVIDEFQHLLPRIDVPAAAPEPYPFTFNAEEQQIVERLAEGESDIDSLARSVGLPISRLSGILLGLEMKRVVRMAPGRRVELTVTLP